jgi:hypothetical protein
MHSAFSREIFKPNKLLFFPNQILFQPEAVLTHNVITLSLLIDNIILKNLTLSTTALDTCYKC